MFEEYHDYIKQESIKEYPLEAVFLITSTRGCYKVQNIAKDPKSTFAVSTANITKAMSEGLLAVVHSHPDFELYPSHADQQTAINYGIPFGLLVTDGEHCTNLIWWGKGVDTPDLQNRIFRFGVTDCYSFIRDYYKLKLDIHLPDFARGWEFWKQGEDLYNKNTKSAGFFRVRDIEDIQPHDMILCNYRSSVPNHGGVYIGDGLIQHHMTNNAAIDESRHPKTEPFHRHKNFISAIYRHKDLYS